MADTQLITHAALAALTGQAVVVTLAESGEDVYGTLATSSSDWIALAGVGGSPMRLYRHAIGSVRPLRPQQV